MKLFYLFLITFVLSKAVAQNMAPKTRKNVRYVTKAQQKQAKEAKAAIERRMKRSQGNRDYQNRHNEAVVRLEAIRR